MLKTTIRPKGSPKSYHYDRQLKVESENIQVNLENIKEKIKELQEKYPNKGFYLERHMVVNASIPLGKSRAFRQQRHMAHRMICWIIGRRNPDRKLRRKDVPIYWSPLYMRLYVPKSYYDRNKRLTCSVISYRLRDLGVPFKLAYT
jgi:hypothetical protein